MTTISPVPKPARFLLLWLCIGAAMTGPAVSGSTPTLFRPRPYEVVQREGFVPRTAHANNPGGPTLGFATVAVQADFAGGDDAVMECRTTMKAGGFGRAIDWTPVAAKRDGSRWSGAVRVPAGGWYRLEVRWVRGTQVLAAAGMEPFGVGEVFLVAGQSYAAGCNDELTRIEDPAGRVAAYDKARNAWQVAHDPQPGAGSGGTIWPHMANPLMPAARVPIGFVNVAVGATSSRQWLPGGPLFENLAAAGSARGRFRAVLWQQGESDVIERTGSDAYVKNLIAIQDAAAKRWGFEPPWLLAKSTLHPTVYNDPVQEGQVREAIDRLCRLPGFRPGPDTDVLGGENRGGMQSLRHFSPVGQRRAGLLWFAAVWAELTRGD